MNHLRGIAREVFHPFNSERENSSLLLKIQPHQASLPLLWPLFTIYQIVHSMSCRLEDFSKPMIAWTSKTCDPNKGKVTSSRQNLPDWVTNATWQCWLLSLHSIVELIFYRDQLTAFRWRGNSKQGRLALFSLLRREKCLDWNLLVITSYRCLIVVKT